MLPRTWRLLQQSTRVLLESVPENIDLERVENALCQIDGVCAIHDLHVWEISSNKISLTAHAVADLDNYAYEYLLNALLDVLHTEFAIEHATLQIEPLNSE